jgi:uncharacterized phiE125 gp8 family phage protein
MALRLITPPAVEVFTLAQAKAHLRVDFTDEDALISALIVAARQYAEGPTGFTGRAFVTQTWELVIDEFPDAEVKIPMPPLQTVTSIKYDDSGGTEQTLDPTLYYVDDVSEPGWVVPITSGWPTTIAAINAVRIQFVAGYDADTSSPPDLTANVPGNIRAAMLLIIGSLYEHREQNVVGVSATQLPMGVNDLLRPHRVELGLA